MKLYLVRHGEALPTEKNPQNPLSAEGRRNVERIVLFLREAGVKVNRVFHSSKLRAAQTASILGTLVIPEGKIAECEGLNPNDPIEPMLDRISRWEDDRMLVGHLPFMSSICRALLKNSTVPVSIHFPPACVVCVEMCPDDHWSFRWMIEPGMLP